MPVALEGRANISRAHSEGEPTNEDDRHRDPFGGRGGGGGGGRLEPPARFGRDPLDDPATPGRIGVGEDDLAGPDPGRARSPLSSSPPSPAPSLPSAASVAEAERTEADDLDRLWSEYLELGSEILKNRLIVHYMRSHVRKIAARLHAGLPSQVELDDLVQEGYLGLVDALERFDAERDVRFETFSGRRIFGAMQDYLRQIDPAPRLSRTRAKQLGRIRERFQVRHGRNPEVEEIRAEMTDVPDKVLRRLLTDGGPGAMVPFSSVQPDGEGADDESDAMHAFSDRGLGSPVERIAHEDLRRWVVRGLSRRDQLIVILYYYEEMTMREVGMTLGISESRVSQRLDAIISCLRSRFCFPEAEAEFKP